MASGSRVDLEGALAVQMGGVSRPLVSFVMPRRKPRQVNRRLRSGVSRGLLRPVEVIIVDDASNEGSVEFARELVRRRERTRLRERDRRRGCKQYWVGGDANTGRHDQCEGGSFANFPAKLLFFCGRHWLYPAS